MPRRVSPQEAHELMQQGWVYLDVRSTPEFERGHPEGAAHVPLNENLGFGMQPNPKFLEQVKAQYPQGSKLILGCQSGNRSMRAAALLEAEGYGDLVEQRAGFGGARDASGRIVEKGWQEAGLPVATGRAK